MTAPTIDVLGERVTRFEATRSACDSWCDGTCVDTNYDGESVLHVSTEIETASVADKADAPAGAVRVKAWRYDALDEPTERGVQLNFADAGWLNGSRLGTFTAEQAIALGQALIATGELILSEETR